MKHTLTALANVLEQDAGEMSRSSVASLLRASLADMGDAGPLVLSPPENSPLLLVEPNAPELRSLRAALREAEHALANERQKVEGLDAALKRQTERSAQIAAELTETQAEKTRKDETNRQLLRRMDDLVAEVEALRAENHALKQAPVLATEAALISLEQAIAEGSDHAPADDEAADMGESPADALVSEPEAVKIADVIAPAAFGGPNNGGRVAVRLDDGVEITLPAALARLAHAMLNTGLTVAHMLEQGWSGSESVAHATISKAKRGIEDATNNAWTVLRVNGAYWALPSAQAKAAIREQATRRNETPAPDNPPASQNEGAAGASPEEGDAASEAGDPGVHDTSEASQFVTSPGTGEGIVTPADPAPAADDGGLIADGDLLTVHPKLRTVTGPGGSYKLDGGTMMVRTLEMMRRGDMFGLDAIARRCGWRNGEVARGAILMERARLEKIGIDLYIDRVNARLRVKGAA